MKHQLRDWVEERLKGLARLGDDGALERTLNAELRSAGLLCDRNGARPSPCDNGDALGYLGAIQFRRASGFLIVQTGVGILCGDDESAYLYSWSGESWNRVWQNEQNTYTEKAYRPQSINAVLVSPYNQANEYLVLTLGTRSWCSSAWTDVYYRAFRLGPDPQAAPLVDKTESSFMGGPVGSVSRNEILVEFTTASISGGVLTRTAVRHFQLNGERLERIAPIALSPRDFVEEWLTQGWAESLRWSEQAGRRALLEQHGKLHKDHVSGEFISPTMHCPATPDLWQVGVDFSEHPPAKTNAPRETYFLVRWRPPYRFTMVRAGDRPWPGCTEKDDDADEPRTLFPQQQR